MDVKKLFSSDGNEILAIDIGSSAVKYVKSARGRIFDYGTKDIAEIFDIPSILKELTKETAPTQVYSFVSGPAVSIRQATFPRMSTKDLKDAILLRLEKYSPFTLEESILDFRVLSDIKEAGVVKDNVMVVSVRRDVISEHIATFRKAGLEPTAISVIPLALASAVRRFGRLRPAETVMVIDIGAQFSNIIVMRNQKLEFARSLTIAGNAITEAMTVAIMTEDGELALGISEAEEIKKQYGIPAEDSTERLPSGIGAKHLLTLQKPVLERFRAEILRSIDYYRREFAVAKIDRLLICGGGALLKNLDKYLESNLGLPTEIFDPFRSHNLYLRNRPFTEGLGVKLVAALGLVLESPAIELLPSEIKSRRLQSRDVKIVAGLYLLVIPLLIILNIIFALQTTTQKRNVEYYKRKIKAFEMINAEYLELKSDVAELETKHKSLQAIVGGESKAVPVLRQLSYLVPENIQLKTLSLTTQKGINFTGTVSGQPFLLDLDLTQFMIQLEASPYFKNVKLVNKSRTLLQGETVLDFEINCLPQ